MAVITWLHLSDLHLCSPKTGWDTDRILKALLADLRKMEQKHDLSPDLLLLTGDLAFGQTKDSSLQAQFEDVSLLLEDIRNSFRHPLAAENIFPVPGNHDVERDKVLKSQSEYLERLAGKDHEQARKTINEMLRDAGPEWQAHVQRLAAYRQFLETVCPHLLQEPDGDGKRLIYAQQRKINGLTLGIAGLNSAWSCGRNQEKGKVWLGGQWQLRTLHKRLEQSDITLALAHHPLNWLAAPENLMPELEQCFNFFLHGHEHHNWVEVKPRHVRIAAGACYGETPVQSGYNFVRLDLEKRLGQVWLRRFDDDGLGWIPRVISNHTDNDGLWTFGLDWLHPSAQKEAEKPGKEENPKKAEEIPPAPKQEPEKGENGREGGGKKPLRVFGRDKDIAKIAGLLEKKPILSLYGISGIGKTVLIREVWRSLPGCVPVDIPVTEHTGADEIFQYLAPVLGCHDQEPKPPRDKLTRLDISALKQYADAEPCLVHLHRAHEAFGDKGFRDPEIRTLLRGLVKTLPQMRIILESNKQPPQELFPEELYQAEKVRGVDAAAVQAFFETPFGRPGDARGWTLKEEDAQALFLRLGGKDKKTGAHPLGMALLAAVADGLHTDPAAMLQRYQHEFYKKFEKRLFKDLYENVLNAAQRHLLRLCALYRRPIPDHHVEFLNERAGDDQAFDALVQRMLLSPDERQELYSLHSLFADLARQRIAENEDWLDDHARIADAWLQPVRGVTRRSLPRIIAAAEAAHHLLEAQEYARLQELSHTLLGRDTATQLETRYGQLFEQGDRDGYYYVLELLVVLDQDNHKARRFLGGEIEKRKGRGDETALQHYYKAHELDPAYPSYLANLGHCLLARREPEKFLALIDGLSESIRERAMDAYVQGIYAKCLERTGKGEQASRIRQELIRAGTRSPVIYNDEAVYLHDQKRYEQALAVLARAQQASIMNEHLLAVKASVLQDMGQSRAASELRQTQITAKTRNPAFYNDEAQSLREQGDASGALAILEQAERAGCANDFNLAIKAKLLEDLDRGGEASQLRRERINAGVRNPVFYCDEAVYLRDRDKYADALTVLDLAERNRCADEVTRKIRRGIEQRRDQKGTKQEDTRLEKPDCDAADSTPKNILMLAANPFLDLRLDEEIRAIQAGLQRAQQRDRFHFIPCPATRGEDLRRALLDQAPAIVHFSGHGEGEAGIVLQSADGPQRVSARALGNLFELFAGQVCCVLLNACYSEVQARAIAEHIAYVIGMSDKIGDEAARVFSAGFYDALGAGRNIKDSCRFACNALELAGIPEEHIPVLFKDGKQVI
ncbi:MAG: CHAT domain-containing protein [Gammaproteobacteria bacterium]|nr:CHAT domain-containing protein [Gammaproteobacteria bacterium]